MRAERWLRGALVAVTGFLLASGLASLFVDRPGPRLQLLLIQHAAVGFVACALMLLYLAVHLVETSSDVRKAVGRVPRWILAVAGLALTSQLMAIVGLLPQARVALRAVGVVALVALAAAAVGSIARGVSVSGKSLRSGGLAALVGALACYEGFQAMVGFRLYGNGMVAPQRLHAPLALIAIVAIALHVGGARRRRLRRADRDERRVGWRRPLLRVALPVALLLAAGAWTQQRWLSGVLPPAEPETGALVEVDRGFAEVEPDACRSCHREVTAGWADSAHARSAANPAFERLLATIREEGGAEQARFCLRCHAPFAPDPVGTPWETVTSSAGFSAGVPCQGCHRVRAGAGYGDGALEGRPRSLERHRFLSELPSPALSWTRRYPWATTLVRNRLDLHRAEQRLAEGPGASCAPCHVQTLGEPTGGRVHAVLQDQHASWRASPLAQVGIGCKACHFPRYVSPGGYQIADHRSLGGSTYLASLASDPARLNAVVAFLRGGDALDTVEHGRAWIERPRTPLLRLDATLACDEAGLHVLVLRTANAGRIGHSFPNAPTDLVQVWLAVEIGDAARPAWVAQGLAGPDDAPRLGHRLLDASGDDVGGHRLWRVARVVERGHVPVVGVHRHELVLPGVPVGDTLSIRARWRYRRFDPALIEGTDLDPDRALPIVDLAKLETELKVPSCSAP